VWRGAKYLSLQGEHNEYRGRGKMRQTEREREKSAQPEAKKARRAQGIASFQKNKFLSALQRYQPNLLAISLSAIRP